MDKYTVDLDQVLNDFEYLELTDQQSRSIPDRPPNTAPFQTPPVTKHSINNVFHSLNEYLNSGINSGNLHAEALLPIADPEKRDTIDNNLVSIEKQQGERLEEQPDCIEGVTTAKTSSVVNSNETEESTSEPPDEAKLVVLAQGNEGRPMGESLTVDAPPECNVYSSKTENVDYSLIDVEESVPDTFPVQEFINGIPECAPSFTNDNLECDINVNGKADNSLDESKGNKEVSNYVDKEQNDQEATSLQGHVEKLLVNLEEDSLQSVSVGNKFENFVIEPSDSPYALDVGQKEAAASKTTPAEHQEEETQAEITEQHLEAPAKDGIEAEEGTVDVPDEAIESSGNDGLEEGNKLENIDNSVEEISMEPPPAAVKIASFSTDLDIDENELNKMLEDLEELEEQGAVEKKVAEEDPKSLETFTEKPVSSSDVNTGEEVSEVETNEVAPDALSSVETPMHEEANVRAEDGERLVKESVQPVVKECLEMERPKKNENNQPVQEDGSSKEPEEHQQGASDEEPAQGLPARPQNLPLNNEVKEEHVARKINLIGSPGSTPYNNVYINKSIEPKSTHDNESDYTSSASPTFSDCSADSTSTASTVSIEDVPNNSKKLPSGKDANSETTNLEAEEKSNVDEAGDGDKTGQLGASRSEESANVADEGATSTTLRSSAPVQGSEQSSETFLDKSWLGKAAPLWIPDADAASCLHCNMKFTVIKRRHHCRACGLVLCSKCCNLKFRLNYLDTESRVCNKCYEILSKDTPNNAGLDNNSAESGHSFRPNPNNPLEYCSTVSPLQQAGQAGAPPPSVMVPVGVLKRKGSNKKSNKSVMFCDGIAPGSDLTILDQDFNYNSASKTPKGVAKIVEEVKKPENVLAPPVGIPGPKISRNLPKIDETTECFIPSNETTLPPTVFITKTDLSYLDCVNSQSVVELLKNQVLTFAINQNLFVRVRIINMNCCINKYAWCFCSEGLINVGCDEVVYLIEYIDEESFVPKDMFFHIQNVYTDAIKGTVVNELGLSLHNTFNFLDSRNHAGFVYIKPTFQCLENVLTPQEPYLIGILIHRWETPWAKLFPLRLILRLGADYRYYPSPLISTRYRDSVFVEIGHTIINLLADFRNFTYTLPQIRGLFIHMEEKKTTIIIPKNSYDQVMKSINNSSEHILAFAGNFSPKADSHLVCIQDTQGPQNNYTTHAINIHNKPRKITGASFIAFNGSLKTSSGLTAKSTIVEDGLMIQIRPESMEKIRDDLRKIKDHTISCGPVNATSSDETETVNIIWGANDCDFNVGVKSPVDLSDLQGVPSIRVHNRNDFLCTNGTRLIRWTEVFILQSGEENPRNQEPLDVSKVSESVSKACCTALVKYLDLLVSNNCQKIGIRATLHVENVSYSAGSNGVKLAPIYMRSLDNELIPVLHGITANNLGDNAIVLELIFRILNA